jgi:ATP-dependent Clp protease ATP-binding subunit ClpC
MYERFTHRALKVMRFANHEAQRFNHEFIDTEQILVGLMKEGEGVAAVVLKHLGLDLQKVRREIEKLVPPGPDAILMGKMPLTGRVTQIIENAWKEAAALEHDYVGTEHLLLGMARQTDGIAAQALKNLGLQLDDIHDEVLILLGHGSRRKRET